MNTLVLVGLGLIGGSFARDARLRGFARRLVGVEQNPASARRAVELGLVDETLSLEEAVAQADLVVVAVPVDAAMTVLPSILDRIRPPQVVTDVCSTKQRLLETVRRHPRRSRFVGGHPMAGTEHAGPEAALSGLFEGKTGILCDENDSDADAVALVEALYRTLGMRIERLDAARHDRKVAYVSHLSHAISYALALTALARETSGETLLHLAGGGFSSTVRLAKSSAQMWVPIFLHNRENVLAALDAYLEELVQFRDALDRRDEASLRKRIDEASRIRSVLP